MKRKTSQKTWQKITVPWLETASLETLDRWPLKQAAAAQEIAAVLSSFKSAYLHDVRLSKISAFFTKIK